MCRMGKEVLREKGSGKTTPLASGKEEQTGGSEIAKLI